MSLSQPISRPISRALSGQLGGRGTASPAQVIELFLTEYPDNTVDLAWTDPVIRSEGIYEVRQNGVLVDTVGYNSPLTYAGAVITNPVEHARWQVRYLNAADSVQARSNVATAVGLAHYAESWRDYENATTISGRRLIAASNQYLEAAHASDLNFTTAMTSLAWVKKAQTANQANCCFFCKGTKDNADLVWGAYGGNYAGLGGDSISFLTDSTTAASAEATSYIGNFAWSVGSSVAKGFRNGALFYTGTAPASLTANTEPLKIGLDGDAEYKNFDGTIYTLALWNRAVSDEHLAILTAGNTPPTYDELEVLISGITAGLVRWWDLGESLTDRVNNVTLTENGTGTIEVEETIVSTTDLSNGLVYEAPVGRGPTKNVDPTIMNGKATAFHDALANESGVTGYSRCTLRAAINQSNLIYTEPTGRVIGTVRYTTALHAQENWYDSVDNDGDLAYDLGGYIAVSGTRRHARRYRNYATSNGHWHSSRSPALDTDYKEDWSFNGGGRTFALNNSSETMTPVFNGATPSWINEIDEQQFAGTTLSGGGGAVGRYGPAIKFDGYPSDLVNAKVDAYLADFYGFDQEASDYDGELYAQAIEAAGYTYDPDDRLADIALFANMRRDGVLGLIREAILPVYGDATVNRVKMIARTNGTYSGGSNTHTVAGKVTFGASGYFSFVQNITQLGISGATDCGLTIIFANNDAAGTNADMGINNAGSNIFEITPNYNNSGRKGYFRLGSFVNNVNSFDGVDLSGVTDVRGIWQMARLGADAFVGVNDYTTDTIIASGSAFSGGTLPNDVPLLGCDSSNGTPSRYTQRAYRGAFVTAGMTSAQGVLFRANIKTWLQARGFV